MRDVSRRTPSCVRRFAKIGLCAIALFSCWIAPSPVRAQQQAPAAVERGALAVGTPTERELAGVGTDGYTYQADREQFVSIVVDQRGIDVVVRLIDPAGKTLVEMDSPNGATGPEPLMFVAETAGTYRVEVQSLDPKAALGRYEIRVAEARPSTSTDRSRIEALAAVNEGNKLRGQRTATARRQMIAEYVRAADLWRDVGDFSNEAVYSNEAALGARSVSEYPKAIALLERAIAAARAGGDRATEGTATNNLGFTYDSYGDKPKALEYYAAATEVYRAIGDQAEIARTYANLGKTYREIGDTQKALDLLTLASTQFREQKDDEWLAGSLNNLGSLYITLHEYQLSIDCLQESAALYRKINKSRGLGTALGNLGHVYTMLGESDRAMGLYKEALDIWIKANNPAGTAVTLNRIASVLDKRADTEKALELLDRALKLYTINHLPGQKAVTNLQLGEIYERRGDGERARDCYQTTLDIARTISEPTLEASALAGLARLDRDAGHLALAEEQLRAAIAIAESLRSKSGGQEARAAVLSTAQPLFEALIDVQMRRQKAEKNDAYVAQALNTSERARARSLVELLAETGIDIKKGVDPALLARERTLGQRLVSKVEYQTQLLSAAQPGEQAKAIASEIGSLRSEYDQVQQQIRLQSPRYAALTQPQPLTCDAIQKDVIDRDSLLLEYALGDQKSYLWVVSTSGVVAYDLPPRSDIEAATRRVLELLTAPGRRIKFETADERAGRLARAEADYAREAAALSRMLLGPAAAQLGNKRLIVAPDGVLQYLPFAALPDPALPDPTTPLVIGHEIVCIPSATALAVLRRETAGRRTAPKTLAVFADPVFSRTDARVKGGTGEPPPAADASRAMAIEAAFDSETRDGAQPSDIPRLTFSRQEAQTIARFVPKPQRFEALDFEANRATLSRPDIGDYRILHIATHGFLNASDPALSGLVLSLVDQKGEPRNGLVLSQEVYNLDLAADLVVLSACRTGLGKDVRGEGLVGLTRGFLYAGARRVIVSLWNVDDRATAVLMEHLYDAMLVKKMAPAAALRQAQISLARDKQWRTPYYWAAFVVQGEWNGR